MGVDYIALLKMLRGKEDDKKHALFSPSSAKRWIKCPLSLDVKGELINERKDSQASAEGTIVHFIAEADLLGQTIPTKKLIKIPTKLINDAADFTHYVRDEQKKHKYEELLVETKIKLPFIHEELSGTTDISLVSIYDKLNTTDLKYGKYYVDHVNNEQILIYLLGLAHKYNYDFAEYVGTIYQPRAGDGKPRSHTYTNKDLKKFIGKLERAVEEAFKPNPKAAPSDECRFCPKKFAKLKDGTTRSCPAISRDALKTAQLDFADDLQPAPKELTKEQLSTILQQAAYLKLWIAEVEKYAVEKLSAKEKVEGFTLAPKRPTIYWRDVEKVTKAMRKYKLEEYLQETQLVTPAAARKNLAKLLGQDRLEKFLNTHTVAISSGYKLKSTNDNDFDLSLESETEVDT